MRVTIDGIEVEIGGVDREDLPAAFNFNEVMRMFEEGKSVDEVTHHVQGIKWCESRRDTEFWDAWHAAV